MLIMNRLNPTEVRRWRPWLGAALVLLVAGAIGSYLQIASHAATPAGSLEAESGSLSGDAGNRPDATASGGQAIVFGAGLPSQLHGLKAFNYYPADHAWNRMWTEYPPAEIDADFAAMQQLHANSVRVIVQVSAFGYPTPAAAKIDELSQVVAMAAAHGLKVQLTLFDFFGNYTSLANSKTWADAVLAPYKDDQRLAFVELQNELNPNNPDAVSWMQYMLPILKTDAGSVPITVSVTDLKAYGSNTQTGDVSVTLGKLIPALAGLPIDFYDIHYYGSAGAYKVLEAIRAEAGGKPLYVGETGVSTYDYVSGSSAEQELRQELQLRTVSLAARQLGFGWPAIWTLRDFAPGQVNGSQAAGTVSGENFYGVTRLDGSLKPAASSVGDFWSTGVVPTDINGDFSDQTGGLPADWFTYDAADGTLAWDGTVGHASNGSLKLSATGNPSGKTPAYSTIPVANLNDGQGVTASVWAKTAAATGVNRLDIDWFDIHGGYLGSASSPFAATGTHDWTKLTVTAAPPSNAVCFQLSVKSTSNSGAVWFDDVSYAVQ